MAAIGSTSAKTDARVPERSPESADWVTQSADTIEKLVVTVRSKTTEPIEWITRILVYGILLAIAGTAALVLSAVLAIRVLDIVLPREVWLAYAVLGIICTLAGFMFFRKRNSEKK